ncbi:uncharacterized protein NECHADRAFT_82413 [Fusarium vanettenii 77-13-4]|uniref:Amine oxidase domain-containing protein n=1 Tax=Fusarium vanettenii (strain ATCC MYA-4622 / CBS 123669 / FGSC 9596 / NRRL 45880 / 77-13-4) TaxID=660122 RepID=C7ZML0_FUSV7|nr:uncharacterized protein NECHADRAFT_82413 [Fusarium vanettenii 77-13-4]EEU34791.1 hypothetical protein NECHADRAFT_82413 [Fusarium vanettenii 77-13-4]
MSRLSSRADSIFDNARTSGNLSYKFCSAAAAVKTADEQTTVTTRDGQTFKARHVVVAVPLNCLKDIAFESGLDPVKAEAIGRGQSNDAYKVCVEASEKEWRNWSGHAFPDKGISVLIGDASPHPETHILSTFTSLPVLAASTLLVSLSLGSYGVLSLTYAMEVSPLPLRGVLGAFYGFGIITRPLLAAGVAQGVISFAITWAWPLVLLPVSLFASESPVWLTRQGRIADAEAALQRLAISDFNIGTDLVLAGVDAETSFLWSLGAGLGALLGAFISLWILAKCLRRPVYIWYQLLSTGLLFILGFIQLDFKYYERRDGVFAQGALMTIWNIFYGAVLSPVSTVIMGEVPSNALRSKTVEFATAVQVFMSVLVLTIYPYLLNPDSGHLQGYIRCEKHVESFDSKARLWDKEKGPEGVQSCIVVTP